jgi:NAD(P)-dependent dehydrogenase (short-subunit alcohol dehydrogenase family)
MSTSRPLDGQVAVVAGATRGAGRGIACALGEAGAIVYCTGRSVRGRPNMTGTWAGRPESIDETAEFVAARGGVGVPVRVDHTVEAEVAALFERVRAEHGRLDVLVNDISGGDVPWGVPFWEMPVAKGLELIQGAIVAHLLTSRHAAPLMVERKRGLIVEVTELDTLDAHLNAWGDIAKTAAKRLAFAMAEELHPHRVAAVAITPGFMRSEAVLDHFTATEATWRDIAASSAEAKRFGLEASESPSFVGRAVAALAADPRLLEKSGGLYSSWGLAREYGFSDVDGSRPDWGVYWDANVKASVEGPTRTGFRWTVTRGATAAEAKRAVRAAKRRAAAAPRA